MPTINDFQVEFNKILTEAADRGQSSIDINSGELHRRLGGYPGKNHRMPICCDVMQQNMKSGDLVVQSPLKGKGASLTIRYQLPR